MVIVKPDAVGAGDAATVPIRACSRNLTLVAVIGEVSHPGSYPLEATVKGGVAELEST